MMLTAGLADDRAAFMLAADLAAADAVFIGSALRVTTMLKGKDVRITRVDHEGAGDRLVVVREGEARTFPISGFEGRFAKPTLALLGGNPDLSAFPLGKSDEETTFRLLNEVFGFEGIPAAARVAAVRRVLTHSPASWEARFASLPEPLHLEALVPAFIEYFTRFPRERFSSATRWTVFRDLKSRAAVPYLLRELDEARLSDELNTVEYIFDAFEASDREAAACAITLILEVDRGLWLRRESDNREAGERLALRLARLGGPRKGCVSERAPILVKGPRGLRALGLFGTGSPQNALTQAETEKDPELAIRAAGRLAERSDHALQWVEPLTVWYTRGQKNAAAEAIARLLTPALLPAWLAKPPPAGLVEAVCASMDFRDRALAGPMLDAVLAGKAPWTCASAIARQSPVVRERAGSDGSRVERLRLAARAGFDAVPFDSIVADLKNPSAEVRAAAIEAVFFLLVGTEDYARGVPHFEKLLDTLGDDDASVRQAGARLVMQLAVKGLYPQYRAAAPELATLHARWLDRAEKARGVQRARLIEGLAQFPDDSVPPGLVARHRRLVGAAK